MATTKTNLKEGSIQWGRIKHDLIKRDLDGDIGRFRTRRVESTIHKRPKHRNQDSDWD